MMKKVIKKFKFNKRIENNNCNWLRKDKKMGFHWNIYKILLLNLYKNLKKLEDRFSIHFKFVSNNKILVIEAQKKNN